MASLKIALMTSLLCMILGIGVIVGGGVALPLLNSAIGNLQTNASNYLQQADNVLANAQNAINSTQVTLLYLSPNTNETLPSLADNSQSASNAGNNLTSVGQKMIEAGQSLSNSSILGATALASVGTTLTSIGQRVNSAANSLAGVSSEINSIEQPTPDRPNKLNTLTVELGNLNSTITDLRTSVSQAQSNLSSFFNPVRLVVLLAIVALMGLGAVFFLIGLSLFTMRRRQLKRLP